MFYQIDRIRKTFADQFEQDGPKIVFRKNLKGAPVEVSAEERDFLLLQFKRHIVWLGVLTAVLTVVVIVGIGIVTFNLNIDSSQPLAFLAVFVILAPVMAAGFWAWNAPDRLIAGRAAIGPARSSSEMKKLGMARLTWTNLAGAAVIGLLLLLRVDRNQSLTSASNLIWISLSALLVLAAAIQSIRKHRAQRKTSQ